MAKKGVCKNPLEWSGPRYEMFRCTAIRANGERCKKYACKGADRCQSHGGDRGDVSFIKHRERLKKLPSLYLKRLGPTLREAIQPQLDASPDEVFDLREELALMRHRASQAVKLYNAAVEQGNEETILSSAEFMASCLKDVADMVKTASSTLTQDKMDEAKVSVVVEQMCLILNQTVELDTARLLERRLRDQLHLPTAAGVAPRPADIIATVHEMDANVMGGDE